MTEFEIRQIAEKWSTKPGDDPKLERIRIQNAIRHAQRIIEEKNRGLDNEKVRIKATVNDRPVDLPVDRKAWAEMWKSFDKMMWHFGKLF